MMKNIWINSEKMSLLTFLFLFVCFPDRKATLMDLCGRIQDGRV